MAETEPRSTKQLEIYVDLDGIAADFFGSLFSTYNKLTGENVKQEDIKGWNMELYVKQPKLMTHLFHVPGFFRALNPLPGAVHALRTLQADGHVINIASSSCTDEGFSEKAAWCKEHLPFIPRSHLMIGHRKQRLFGYVVIDDGTHNAEGFRKNNPDAFILGIRYPHNADGRSHFDLLADDHANPAVAWMEIVERIRARSDPRFIIHIPGYP